MLAERLHRDSQLGDRAIERVHVLLGEWQLLSDLSFADLVLWIQMLDGGWHAVAHVRPNTGQMVFFDDIVGQVAMGDRARLLEQAKYEGAVLRRGGPILDHDHAIREEAVPLRDQGGTIAILTRHTNLTALRTPSRLELSYQGLAANLVRMIAAGEWPTASAPTGHRRGAPRVSDGVIHLGVDGLVRYASPNALSAIHRLGHDGEVIGEHLTQIFTDVLRDEGQVDEALAVVTTGRADWRADVATRAGAVALRAIPLTEDHQRIGAMILLRDVTELRRREHELLSKDATIREIHHRVKNNLQTVAALLRLQARRLPPGQGKDALDEAVRRVGTIAMVHETLSHGFDETVDFDDIAVRGLQAVIEVASQEQHIESRVAGTFGRMRAEDAMALAMVISELVQNAVEHGLADRGGRIEVLVDREEGEDGVVLRVTIADNGTGIPPGFRPGKAGLGTQIVNSLVQDLRGAIRWEDVNPHGTRVRFFACLRPLERES
ncbi:MAG: histidine kinase N-terminal domain-containing protein [Dermatophilaceae bacterium]